MSSFQVHSFCCTLIENVLVYGSQSKSDDAASLRIVCMQCPALLNAVEVMVEQCTKRLQDVEKSREMSIQRKVDLRELDVYGPGPSPGSSPKAPRKRPHNKKGPPKEVSTRGRRKERGFNLRGSPKLQGNVRK